MSKIIHTLTLLKKLMIKILNFKLAIRSNVRILKYESIFANRYTPNWSEEVFVIKEVKNKFPWTYVINDLNGEKIIGTFYEKDFKKQINKNLG